ncbi:MAG TPA: hypothetical protein VHC72_10480, partial [Bryobacteraceae bacterium]|nr:hypothetical protein [Bryobacteraceae bacterium]
MNTVEYKGFTCRYPLITYSYAWKGREYHRQVDLGNLSRVQSENCDAMVRDRLIAHVGLAIAREFFRIGRIDRISVRPPHFFEESAAFFETWFRAGLAELRYVNGIPLDAPIEFLIDKPQNPQPAECTGTGILLCNGGGKDSVVAAEALNHAGEPFTWLSLSPSLAMEGIQSLSGAPGLHVRAGLGRAEFKAQKRFKGHLPFLPMVALTGTLVAHLQNFACVAAGNEYSANFGNLEHNGFSVNHQYGKSFEFENLFRAYLARNLTRISWFSVLQPFYELQIAQAFARFPQYFQVFKSCNAGHRRDRWCRHCPKCAFIYLTLSAFLDRTAIFEIFDGDPWKESRIRETVRDLVTGARKPFECVGTFDEAREAARLMLENP